MVITCLFAFCNTWFLFLLFPSTVTQYLEEEVLQFLCCSLIIQCLALLSPQVLGLHQIHMAVTLTTNTSLGWVSLTRLSAVSLF